MEKLHKLKILSSLPFYTNLVRVEGIPQTATRVHFLSITGYQLDGIHSHLQGIYPIGGRITKASSICLNKRLLAPKRLITPPGLEKYPSSYQQAETTEPYGVIHSCRGPLMRKFESSLFENVFQLSFAACFAAPL
jgi:hypothetical protein